MTQPAQAASIDLAHDELIWLLSSLRLPPMIGMPERFFPEALSLETVEARLQAGAASLRARGFVSSDGENTTIDGFIMGLLGAYAFAARTAVINITPAPENGSNVWVYYRGANLCVEHTLAAPGVHRFTVLDDAIVGAQALSHLPPLTAAGWELEAQPIPSQTLGDAIQRAKTSAPAAASALLQAGGWTAQLADAFVHVLTTQTGGASIGILSAEGEGEARRLTSQQSVILVIAPDANAHITALGEDAAGTPYSGVAFYNAAQLETDLRARLLAQ